MEKDIKNFKVDLKAVEKVMYKIVSYVRLFVCITYIIYIELIFLFVVFNLWLFGLIWADFL